MSPVASCRPVRLVPFRAVLSGVRAAEVRAVRLQRVCTKASQANGVDERVFEVGIARQQGAVPVHVEILMCAKARPSADELHHAP